MGVQNPQTPHQHNVWQLVKRYLKFIATLFYANTTKIIFKSKSLPLRNIHRIINVNVKYRNSATTNKIHLTINKYSSTSVFI